MTKKEKKERLEDLVASIMFTRREFEFLGRRFWSQEDEGSWHIFTEDKPAIEEKPGVITCPSWIPFCYYDEWTGREKSARWVTNRIMESIDFEEE